MDYLLPALGIAGLLVQVGTLIAVFLKVQDKKAAKHALGQHYAKMAVAHARTFGGEFADVRQRAVQGFLIADKALDGKQDFDEQQAGLYVDEALQEGK